jgi:hypothetical protein
VTRGLRAAWIAATCAVLLVGAAGAIAAKPKPKPKKKPKTPVPAIRLNTKDPGVLVLTAPGYRLTLSKANGEIIDLLDRRTGVHVVLGQNGCLWAAKQTTGATTNGCAFDRMGENRFSYRWSQASTTLTLEYAGGSGSAGVDATLTLLARSSAFDMSLALTSNTEYPVSAVLFPGDLLGNATQVEAAYAPTFLPGLELSKGFFSEPHRDVEVYPSRWAFADFLAADVGPSHVAVYSINPSPQPIAPVDLGFISNAAPAPCSGAAFCMTHVFQTWIPDGERWQSPVVRIAVGGSIKQSLEAYREENGIDRYPSLEEKLGPRLDTLAQAPLIKADIWKGLPLFQGWSPYLQRLPQPALLHPVAFQSGGFDKAHPDFLPPDPKWGSVGDLNSVFVQTRALGGLVMPYLNVSWWDTQAPSVHALVPPLEPKDIAVQTIRGTAVREQFGDKDGYIVSPSAPEVRTRVAGVLEEWQTEAQADCLFFDQLGARPWRRDFNPAAPNPLVYYDAWLSLFARYTDRCFMVEDGWDRLAESFSGFHGGLLQMSREFKWPDRFFGPGNWEPFPIADWLFHDKVLMYEHDLYEPTMAGDPEVVTFNLAFGLIASYNWDGETDSIDSPWMGLAGQLQRTLGPLYAGKRLVAFRDLAEGVTESVWEGGFSVVANWNTGPVDVDGQTIAPQGFLARSGDGTILAATFGPTWQWVTFPAGSR